MANSKTLSLLVSVLVVCVVSVCIAAQDKEAGDKAHWGVAAVRSNGDIDTDGAVVSTGAVTSSSTLTGTEAVIDSKYAVTGGDATTGLMIQKAAITSTATALQTNSFAVAYGAAPVVVASYTEDPGDVRPIFIVSVTPSNFVASVTADKNFAYIAVGSRP